MPFGGKGRLRKLCNEGAEAFDILCRRLRAVSVQHRGRIMERERERGGKTMWRRVRRRDYRRENEED